jgi:hypothetical protein
MPFHVPTKPERPAVAGQWAVHRQAVPLSPAQLGITATEILVELPLKVNC